MARSKCDLLVKNIGELLTLDTGKPVPRRGKDLEDLGILRHAAVAVEGERILRVGPTETLESDFEAERTLDAGGTLCSPGFVDPHTHPAFAATREHEFEMRIKGTPYEEIARKGGGILSSVEAVRKASPAELEEAVRRHADSFLAHGTTTIEAKSGYGLTVSDEIKSLEAIRSVDAGHPLDLVPTFLGAHEMPAEFRSDREAYIRLLVEEMIPEVGRRGLAKYCDVFCERNVFDVGESRRILKAAQEAGMKPRMHADEFSAMGGSELAGELKAVTADHLVSITDRGIRALKEGGVIPVFLPATSFYLNLPSDAPARKMVEQGLPVALSTDFNPGSSMTESMQFVLTLACVRLRLTPAEAFTASTLNGACALELEGDRGRVAEGLLADLIVFDAPNYRYVPYHFGVNHVRCVIKRGKVVVGTLG